MPWGFSGFLGWEATDRDCYDWAKAHNEGSPLPAFDTWQRYVRQARQHYGQQKNAPLAGRSHGRVQKLMTDDTANRTSETADWDVDLLPIELGELRDEGFDLKLLGFTDKELAERLKEFDTDLDDGQADAEEAADTIRCPKCGHEFPLE